MLWSWNVAHCFHPLWPWSQESVLEKMHPQQIAHFIYGSIPYLVFRYILDPGESPNVSRSLWPWPLVSALARSNIIWGRNPKFGVRIYFGIMACCIHFWVNLTCSMYISTYKNTADFIFITLLIMPRLSKYEPSGTIGMILAHFKSN